MRQLDHPNIIKLVEFSESRQYYYIVLELAPGGELFHQIVRLTYFSEELSRHVIVQVAKALEYLHEEKGVVHRYVMIFCCLVVDVRRPVTPEMVMPLLTSFAPARPWMR
jgi:serine/threonine protein kinase